MRVKVACCTALLIGLLVSPAMADVIIQLVPSATNVSVGDTFTVTINATLEEPVLGWGLDLIGDTGLATPDGVAIGTNWDPAYAADGDDLAGLHFPPPGVTGTVELATVSFTAVAGGTIHFMPAVTAGDLTEGFALDPVGFATIQFGNGCIVNTPEPASLALLGLVALLRRR